MKKYLAVAIMVTVLVSGCGWLARHASESSGTPAPKAQICPDDPLACR